MFKRSVLFMILIMLPNCTSEPPIDKAHVTQEARMAVQFLQNCRYLRKHFPQAYINLQYVKEIKIKFDYSVDEFCGRHENRVIWLYGPALREEPGCYGSMHYVIAHEMLHRLGLPKHKVDPRKHWTEYIQTDIIERVMIECEIEEGLKK